MAAADLAESRADIALTPALITEREAAAYLRMTPRWLQVRRYEGGGPRYVRVSSRCVRYRISDLDAWAAERLRTSTSDDAAAR